MIIEMVMFYRLIAYRTSPFFSLHKAYLNDVCTYDGHSYKPELDVCNRLYQNTKGANEYEPSLWF